MCEVPALCKAANRHKTHTLMLAGTQQAPNFAVPEAKQQELAFGVWVCDIYVGLYYFQVVVTKCRHPDLGIVQSGLLDLSDCSQLSQPVVCDLAPMLAPSMPPSDFPRVAGAYDHTRVRWVLFCPALWGRRLRLSHMNAESSSPSRYYSRKIIILHYRHCPTLF